MPSHGILPRAQPRRPAPGPLASLQAGGASHMVRFAANVYARTHSFWLDVPARHRLSVRVSRGLGHQAWLDDSGTLPP